MHKKASRIGTNRALTPKLLIRHERTAFMWHTSHPGAGNIVLPMRAVSECCAGTWDCSLYHWLLVLLSSVGVDNYRSAIGFCEK